MDFVFQGFQSALPVWVYMLLMVASIVLAWWSYKHLHSIASLLRYVLTGLRAAVFFVLLVILLNPFYKAESTYFENPQILVFLDNSESTTLQTVNYAAHDSYQSVIDALNLADSSDIDFAIYSFGQQVHSVKPDSLTFDDDQTNLFNVVEIIKNKEDEIAGSVIVSDGIFNQGRNPVFQSQTINTPIFTIGLGDTTHQRDLIVKNVVTNNTGYVKTRHLLEVTVVNNGFINTPFEVQILKNDQPLASQTVRPAQENSTHTLNFEIELTQEGLQQFVVNIPALQAEWTSVNNTQAFAVDVLDQKQRILSLAFEIHPDVRFVRSLLLTDANTKLYKRTWLGGAKFVEGPLRVSPDSLDLVVLQGFPATGLPEATKQALSALLTKVPVLFMATPGSNLQNLARTFNLSLPVVAANNIAVQEIGFKPSLKATEHPIMELPEINIKRLPTISGPVNGTEVSTGATMLFENVYLGNKTGQPTIAIQELGNNRLTFISAYGWFRLAQNSNAQDRRYVTKLFENIISWTATQPDNRKLRVQPAKKVFSGTEIVSLNGFLKNESGQTESDGTIEITLKGEDIDDRFYSMDNTGDGTYNLSIGSLPEGLYTYIATAQKGSRIIDSTSSEFSVSKSNAEFVNTIRNDRVLNQLATNTGGEYLLFNSMNNFRERLNKKGMLSKKEKISDTLFFPYQHSFWFIIVIALLGAEWIIRKYLALP